VVARSNGGGLSPLGSTEPYDVCIVGSGPAGTILGTTLARRGLRTLILESGRGMLSWLANQQIRSLARYDFTGNTDYPLSRTTSRILGGNSNFWTGRCERFHPADFELHPYTPPENPWPIGYADLDSYYDDAERLLRVRGGPRSPFSPPRRHPLPLPPSPDIGFLKRLGEVIGLDLEESATATPQKTMRVFNVQKEILPGFHASGHGTVVTGATATRIIAGCDGTISGIEVKTVDGGSAIARARCFVVSCGGIETPRLLLLSASERFPAGIGNGYDQVGRGFNDHPNLSYQTNIPHTRDTLTPTNKIARSHQFYNTYRGEGLGSVLLVMRQAWVLPNHIGVVRAATLLRNSVGILARLVSAPLQIGASFEIKPSPSNRVMLSRTHTDLFGRPIAHLVFNYADEDLRLMERGRELLRGWIPKVGGIGSHEIEVAWSRHHLSTCRMGSSPTTSVVNADLRVHDTRNLYLCGSEAFVTGGGQQPTLTIAAMALRLADHLTARLRAG